MKTTLTDDTLEQDFEQNLKDSFIKFISVAEGASYRTDGRHVPNRTDTGNFDFHLVSENGETIALELTTLTRGRDELIASAHFDEFVRTVNKFVDPATLPGRFIVYAPYGALGSLNEFRVELTKRGPEVGNQIRRAVGDLRAGEERHLDTSLDEIILEKIDDRTPGSLSFSGESPNEHWGDYEGLNFVRDALKRILKKKNNQLDTQADRRILLISNQLAFRVNTNRLWPPLSELMMKAILHISETDSAIMSNIDELFFEEEPSKFERVDEPMVLHG